MEAHGYHTEEPEGTPGLAIAGMVVGIVSLIISIIPCVGTLGWIPGIIGLILSGIGLKMAGDRGQKKGMAIAGLVLSIIAILIAVVQIAFIGAAADSVSDDLSTAATDYTDAINSASEDLSDLDQDFDQTE